MRVDYRRPVHVTEVLVVVRDYLSLIYDFECFFWEEDEIAWEVKP